MSIANMRCCAICLHRETLHRTPASIDACCCQHRFSQTLCRCSAGQCLCLNRCNLCHVLVLCSHASHFCAGGGGGIHTTSGAASAASLYESHYCTSICVCVFCLRPAGTDFSKRRGPNQKKIFAPLDVLYKGSRNIIFLAWRKNFSKWKKTRKKRKRSKNGKKKKKRGKKAFFLPGWLRKQKGRST